MSTPEKTPHEETRDARRALAETRASTAATAAIIEEARVTFGSVRAHRQANHYADKFRAIIRGTQ
jgi:hypothetical protein